MECECVRAICVSAYLMTLYQLETTTTALFACVTVSLTTLSELETMYS
jgi:hypothetical protein